MKDFLFFTLIASMGFFLGDLLIGSLFQGSIHFEDITSILIVAALFTSVHFAVGNRIPNSVALFVFNMFIIYVLDLALPFFSASSVLSIFLLALTLSIVDALMTSEE